MNPLPGAPDSGIILIDKPRGPSSHQVTAWVGEMLGRKVGHSGTLDPKVSGLLAVMFGKAVRLAPFLLTERKEYVCLMHLHSRVAPGRLGEVAEEFTGRIYQRPPSRSAVARNLRIRTIFSIEILDVQGLFVLFRVECDAGTYIRSLCHHIGLALGTGAHMQELRRTRSGQYDESHAFSLHEILDACEVAKEGNPSHLNTLIIPLNRATDGFPEVKIRDTAVDAICRGAGLSGVGIISNTPFSKGQMVSIRTTKSELVALGISLVESSTTVPGKTGLVVVPRIVFMEPGTYPRGWHKGSKSGSNTAVGQ